MSRFKKDLVVLLSLAGIGALAWNVGKGRRTASQAEYDRLRRDIEQGNLEVERGQ